MEIKRKSLSEGSCNSCYVGKLSKDGMGLDFPYKEITEIDFRSIRIKLCDKCLNKLKVMIELEIVNQDGGEQ